MRSRIMFNKSCQQTWLFRSKQFQCVSNSCKQCSRILLILRKLVTDCQTEKHAHRSLAQRVTLLPSFRQCSGSRLSFLQCIKSSCGNKVSKMVHWLQRCIPLYFWQWAPIKKAALFKGALLTPSSSTFGTWSGIGAGSTYGTLAAEPS